MRIGGCPCGERRGGQRRAARLGAKAFWSLGKALVGSVPRYAARRMAEKSGHRVKVSRSGLPKMAKERERERENVILSLLLSV